MLTQIIDRFRQHANPDSYTRLLLDVMGVLAAVPREFTLAQKWEFYSRVDQAIRTMEGLGHWQQAAALRQEMPGDRRIAAL